MFDFLLFGRNGGFHLGSVDHGLLFTVGGIIAKGKQMHALFQFYYFGNRGLGKYRSVGNDDHGTPL